MQRATSPELARKGRCQPSAARLVGSDVNWRRGPTFMRHGPMPGGTSRRPRPGESHVCTVSTPTWSVPSRPDGQHPPAGVISGLARARWEGSLRRSRRHFGSCAGSALPGGKVAAGDPGVPVHWVEAVPHAEGVPEVPPAHTAASALTGPPCPGVDREPCGAPLPSGAGSLFNTNSGPPVREVNRRPVSPGLASPNCADHGSRAILPLHVASCPEGARQAWVSPTDHPPVVSNPL